MQTSVVNETTLTGRVESDVAATDCVAPTAIELFGAKEITWPGNIVVVRGTWVAAFQSSFPACDAVIVQSPAFLIIRVLSETVQTSSVELVYVIVNPEDAVAWRV